LVVLEIVPLSPATRISERAGEDVILEQRGVLERITDAAHRRWLNEAAARIFAEHGDFIRGVIRFRVQDPSKQQDVFQEFFLRLLSQPVPANVQNIRGWLYQAIIHDVVDLARRSERHSYHMKKYAEEIRISIHKRPSRDAIAEETATKDSRFGYLVRNLRRREAQVVMMRFRDDYSIAEIAERIGVHKRTVSRYLTSGLRQLRRTLAIE
jgi:RNA polymerase sigma factor (sigma-70 family)